MSKAVEELAQSRALRMFSSDLRQLSAPLLERLNLNYFQYLTVFKDGGFSFATTQPGWSEFCLQQYTRQPQQQGVYSHLSERTKDSQQFSFLWDKNLPEYPIRCAREFNIHQGITFVERFKNYYNLFAFAAPQSHHNPVDTYFNHQQELLNFILQFKSHKKILSDIKSNKIQLNIGDPNKDAMILKEAGLTPRELEVYSRLKQGKTYKAIAIEMGISVRTVETYIQRVQYRA